MAGAGQNTLRAMVLFGLMMGAGIAAAMLIGAVLVCIAFVVDPLLYGEDAAAHDGDLALLLFGIVFALAAFFQASVLPVAACSAWLTWLMVGARTVPPAGILTVGALLAVLIWLLLAGGWAALPVAIGCGLVLPLIMRRIRTWADRAWFAAGRAT